VRSHLGETPGVSSPIDDELHICVRMRLDGDGRPTGTVRADGGTAMAFVGWVSLMGELSRLVEAVDGDEQRNG
jgi:hypothetical protein